MRTTTHMTAIKSADARSSIPNIYTTVIIMAAVTIEITHLWLEKAYCNQETVVEGINPLGSTSVKIMV